MRFGVSRCDAARRLAPGPAAEAVRAAAAARRLDDTFRSYLAERGAKPVPLAEVTSLVTGVVGLRLAGDAVLDLWQARRRPADGDRAAARRELLAESERMTGWYDAARREPHRPRRGARPAAAGPAAPPPARRRRQPRPARPTTAERRATAVRVIWTGDHLDAARRLQTTLVGPARATTGGA